MLRRSPKISMYLVNARLVVRNAAKTVNTKLDLRNAANSLQIEGNWGLLPGDPTHGGGRGGREKTRTMWRGAFFAKIYPTLRKNLPYESGGGGGGETEDGTIYIYITVWL